MRRSFVLFFCVLSVLVPSLITGTAAATPNSEQKKIVAVIYPLKLFLMELGVPAETISVLVPVGQDLHHYEITPTLFTSLQKADLILTASGIELNKMILRDDVLTEKVVSIGAPTDMIRHGWFSMELIEKNILGIFSRLCQPPAAVDGFTCNTPDAKKEEFLSRIRSVFDDAKRTMGETPCSFISDHESLSEFAQTFGCQQIFSVKIRTAEEFTIRRMAEVLAYKDRKPSPFFITEPDTPANLIRFIAEDLKLQAVKVDESGRDARSFTEFFKTLSSLFTSAAKDVVTNQSNVSETRM